MAENLRITQPKLEVKHGNKGSAVLAVGTVTLDGTNPTAVDCLAVHGIGTVQGAVVNYKHGTAPALDHNNITCDWTSATLNVYAWKVTASGNATEIASSDNTVVVSYVVWGTV